MYNIIYFFSGIQIQASSLESLRKEYVALACANKAIGESKSGSVATSETKDTEIIELEEVSIYICGCSDVQLYLCMYVCVDSRGVNGGN